MNTLHRGDWILTFTGKKYWPLTPHPEDININDIAHALSMQCRYAGHVKEFYSTAEHCYWLSMLCEEQLKALLHDSAEAYLSDIVRPLKHTPEFEFYRIIEERNEKVIAPVFGLEDFHGSQLKEYDSRIIFDEALHLMNHIPDEWEIGEPLGIDIQAWSPKEAEAMFLKRFKQLYEN